MTTEQVRERIRAKIAKGKTYKAIAESCGVSPSMVYHFLRGSDVMTKTLDKLKKA